MHSSKLDHENWCTPQQLARLKELLASENITLVSKSGGGNSKVFCVEAAGEKWAVKSYPPQSMGQRDRLMAEVRAYQFLNQQQVSAVPLLKAVCNEERWLVMNWIEGCLPKKYSASDILQAIEFIRTIAQLNSHPDALILLPQAAEACLSLTVLIQQILGRFNRLTSLPDQDPVLMDFLRLEFLPVFERHRQRAIAGYEAQGIDPDRELAQEHRSLIPADFGFHNAIREETGQLYFFDFDYFGWDDPVKLLADILWHPKMQFSADQAQHIIRGLANIYYDDAAFLTRFSYTCPLFGLRWVLILLNEFITEYWLNRQHAEVYQDQQTAKKIQLQRANALLMKVQQTGHAYE
jgi:hypothetical protein